MSVMFVIYYEQVVVLNLRLREWIGLDREL